MRNIFIATIFLLLPSITSASSVKDFSASYAVYKNGFFLGNTKRTLTTKNNILNYTAVTETAGIAAWFFDVTIFEKSKLILKNDSLNIYSYKYDEKNKDKHTIHELHIDDNKQLYHSYTKQHYPITKNLHDGLGFNIAMMHDLKKGLRDIKYTIAEKEKLKDYHIKFVKEETLPADNGGLKTIKIEHTNPKTKDRFTFWCVESMGFLPVRIQNVKDNGDEVLLNLTHYNNKEVYLYLDDD
ncbi:MAG: DUF3108 domain-containing protein [Gammaproteobacteria bacterium]|nr:DUF3108 domain-containing protein [Gammaproteobacteria bacterium]MCW8988755.1 DUF3108 domain-containing protein [Gammaproteobacteria bacterium]MCW9031733.1 DUF3108 domain-containing protein [Gammaproteobacteria bacterium]